MKNNGVKLKTKILLLNIIITFISLVVMIAYMIQLRISWIRQETEYNLMNISKILSKSPLVKETLSGKENREKLQAYLKEVVTLSKNVDSIIITDLNGNTYGNSKINELPSKSSVNIGEIAARSNSEYLEDNVISFGKFIISFAVVRDVNKFPLGFVMGRVFVKNVESSKYEIILVLALVILSGLFIGSVLALIISKNIKESLLGYEPEQISKLFIQKQEVLNTLDEGIIAIDEKLNITFFNKAALQILKIEEKDITGFSIFKIIPNSNLPNIFKNGQAEYKKQMIINNTVIFTNRIPIKENERIIAAVTIFRDKTEVTRLAEEVTGVKQVVEALRANNHEFMNKLHVILGLIQINELEEAKKYILNQTKVQQKKVSIVMNKIKDSTIAALLLGKISRAKEMGVELIIDEKSNLNKRKGSINSHSLVTIIGNLIENAVEAVSLTEKAEKSVYILLSENEYEIFIKVKDVGIGMKEEIMPYIFKNDFSTKGENRGKGLWILKETLENLNGEIDVSSRAGLGTEFTVLIPKEDEYV